MTEHSPPPPAPSHVVPLRFVRRGQVVEIGNVSPQRTLLELLREDLRLCDTKEACASGDCGACTVMVGELHEGQLRTRAVNSCIKPAHSIRDQALWTADDLPRADGRLHPVQDALVRCHASQCGFCTPGFTMSLLALYERTVAQGRTVDRSQALQAISGNLCRCTGYRPILDAACSLRADPAHALDRETVVRQLEALAATRADDRGSDYQRPTTLNDLLQARARHPEAQLVAGATDLGLGITQGEPTWRQLIEVSSVAPLRRIESYPHHLAIGAAAPLQEAFDALSVHWPAVHAFGERFAGWPVRQSGTLGGNIVNGSPIGDSMPLLIALGAQVILMAWRRGRAVHRHVPLEDFYTGYKRHLLARDEVLAWVVVPKPQAQDWLGVYKVSKRHEDDISAVCLAVWLRHENGVRQGRIEAVRIGAGGVAAQPMRARQTEATLLGQTWSEDRVARAADTIGEEFQPLSDLRASASYRRLLLGRLLHRAWLESQGRHDVRLEELA